MHIHLRRKWAHAVVTLGVMGLVAAGCGDGGGSDEGDEFVGPVAAGVFVGETSRGETITMEVTGPNVDRFTQVVVGCGGPGFDVSAVESGPIPSATPSPSTSVSPSLTVTPSPSPTPNPIPQPTIEADGSFVVFLAGDKGTRLLTMDGRFLSQNRLRGTISGDPFCEGPFEAERCVGTGHPLDTSCAAPTFTPPPSKTPTPIATLTPTPILTVTPTGLTPTATASTPAPEETPNCGNGEIEGDEECDSNDLDDSTCDTLCDEPDPPGTLSCTSQCKYDFSECLGTDCEP